jgi:K+-transporting ATPase ATPase B chain
MRGKISNLLQSDLIWPAVKDSFLKLNPLTLWRNVVMFVVEITAVVTTVITVFDIFNAGNTYLDAQISIWLWFTILFATFSEALAEGRGRAQAESLRRARSDAMANMLLDDGRVERVSATKLRWRHY